MNKRPGSSFGARTAALSLLTTLLIAGCGGGGGGDGGAGAPAAPAAPSTVGGGALKGVIAGATVSVLDADGQDLGITATTGSDGSYTLEIPGDLISAGIATPLQIVISSDGTATTVCDADLDVPGLDDCYVEDDPGGIPLYAAYGTSFPLSADFVMRAVLTTLPGSGDGGVTVTTNPTPLTEIATALALDGGVSLTDAQVDDANALVLALLEYLYGVDASGADVNTIAVVDLSTPADAAAASALELAAAVFAAAVIDLVDPADPTLDSIAEVVTALAAAMVDNVQSSGNPNALPAQLLGELAGAGRNVLDGLEGQLTEAGTANAALAGLRATAANNASNLAHAGPDDNVILTPDDGGNDGGEPNGTTSPATVNPGLAGEYDLVYFDASDNNASDPFTNDQQVTATISTGGTLTIGELSLTDPFFRDAGGNGEPTEIYWWDQSSNIEYAASNNATGVFNEINVGDASIPDNSGNPAFLGQLTEIGGGGDGGNGVLAACGDNAGGTVTGLQLLINCQGEYIVQADPAHQRGTITIGADGSVDFDTGIAFPASPAPTVFDRLDDFIDGVSRIQANYGADDDGPVIQLYFSQESGQLVEIEYRNRNEEILTRVSVGQILVAQ